MTFNRVYLEDVVESQGELFQYAYINNKDLLEFAYSYMSSDLRRWLDEGYPKYLNMLGIELYDELGLKSCTRDLPYDTRSDWFGQFLALLQYHTAINSRDLSKYFDYKHILSIYDVYHDLDIELAVKRMIETKKFEGRN